MFSVFRVAYCDSISLMLNLVNLKVILFSHSSQHSGLNFVAFSLARVGLLASISDLLQSSLLMFLRSRIHSGLMFPICGTACLASTPSTLEFVNFGPITPVRSFVRPGLCSSIIDFVHMELVLLLRSAIHLGSSSLAQGIAQSSSLTPLPDFVPLVSSALLKSSA